MRADDPWAVRAGFVIGAIIGLVAGLILAASQ
jgi:gas vesicle protein